MTRFTAKPAASLAVVALVAGVWAAPAAAQSLPAPQAERLNAAAADYTYYRHRGWRGNRGAFVAGAVGLGVLGAAVAASQPAYGYGYGYGYAEPVYAEPEPYAYGYGYAPVYEVPVAPYPRRRGPYADTYRGAPDPARGGR